ncbi:MAG TPA: RNase adapter RapZ [Solirubrobacteraceae bacterium]|nr:RNase adapter RapZ [Solirubrobacteraceae bacterium]
MSDGAGGRRLEDLVVISGFSGAGKSLAMNVFEDAGYFCVDNLPAEMIRSLADLFTHGGSQVAHAAVVSDLRGGTYFEGLAAEIDRLRAAGVRLRVLFLTADEETLLTRFKETRRRHPLAQEGDVLAGVRREEEMLAPIRDRADAVIDTTGLSAATLRQKITAEMLGGPSSGRLAVTFLSFGFKHGPARAADLLFDVRFLPNPHWERDLRPLTGFEPSVVEYMARDGRLDEFYARIVPLLEYLLPQYVAEGKSHLLVAIGCTGGRHRSVAIAEELSARFRDDERFLVGVQHRDVERAAARG